MKQPETKFKERVQKDLRKLGPRFWFQKMDNRAVRGIPDIFFFSPGGGGVIELKKDQTEMDGMANDKTGAMQVVVMTRIVAAGGLALVACPENWKAIYELLKRKALGK